MRILVGIVILFLFHSAFAQQPDTEDVIRVDSNLVSIPVSVADKEGRFVSNLTVSDFQLFDNERERKIEYFESSEQPFSVLLLLDTSGSTASRFEDIKKSALAMIDQLKPNDQILPVAFDMQIKPLLPRWTNNHALVKNTIQNAKFGIDYNLAKKETETIRGTQIVTYYVSTRLYDAVSYAAEACRRIRGRKAVILLSDGFDTGSVKATYKSTIREISELDALFYTIKYDKQRFYPRAVLKPAEWDALEYMKVLAEKSGASFREAGDVDKINQAFAAIAQELRQTYTLGFYVDDSEAATGDRKLKVRLKQSKFVVRGRKTYFFKRAGTNGKN